MSEFIKNSEIIKNLSKEEIYEMFEKKHKETLYLKETIRVLRFKLRDAVSDAEKFERLWNSAKYCEDAKETKC